MKQLKITASERIKSNTAFMDFVKSLPETFNQTGTEIHTARNRLRIMNVGHLGVEGLDQVMVKRYHGLFWFQKLDYTFIRKPKCRKAFDNTAELRRRGFEAAEELAIVEVWNHGLYQYGFFVSEVGKGERLDRLVTGMQERHETEAVKKVIMQFAVFLKNMHEHGILYMDMNCGNVLCRQERAGNDWSFCLIDTNRARLFEQTRHLSIDEAMPDLILMNPKMGTVELFIEDYLRVRSRYSIKEVQRIRQIQHQRHEKKRPIKKFFKRYKNAYYKWLEK